ncbi:MAG: HD domain-containing protein [Geobacter sp.]
MTLSDIELVPGYSFRVESRIRHPLKRIAANGTSYLSFMLEDYGTAIKAHAWPEQCDTSGEVRDLEKVMIGGKFRDFDGKIIARVTSIRPVSTSLSGSVNLIPRSICPEPDQLNALRELVSSVANEPLRHFLNSVFSDDSFSMSFVRLPASRKHHHSEAGGLLKHSLECAAMVRHFSEFSQDMLDLAVVAALLHDAGKVLTLHNTRFVPERALINHDALTLEVLAPHLKLLASLNNDVATALRYLWTWRHHRRGNGPPALTVAEAITAADRISSGLNVEEQVFSKSLGWQSVVKSDIHGGRLWKPQLCSKTLDDRRVEA